MIVSVSRRTDVPAFHFEWFMNRLRAGYALSRNPMCQKRVHRIPLTTSDVDLLCFITKNPSPCIPHLRKVMDMGYEMSFQITVNPYGRALEPNVPPLDDVIESFRDVSRMIGSDRTVWRYDPVVFGKGFDIRFHIEMFEYIASRLQGYTERCVFSFLGCYEKHEGLVMSGRLREVSGEERLSFLESIPRLASRHGIEMSNCCPDSDLSGYGVATRGCVDAQALKEWGIPYDAGRYAVRDNCRCVKMVDIGAYDTCSHDCIYCYANRMDHVRRSSRRYDPKSELLYGVVEPDDEIVGMRRRKDARLSDFF